MRPVAAFTVGVLMSGVLALAQVPDGVLSGRVTHGETSMPGVAVKASSDALQGGARTTVSGQNGDYLLRFLPAGDYVVTFDHEGFQTLRASLKISVAQTLTVDAMMIPEAVTGEIRVTSARETISSGAAAATSFEQKVIDVLPVGRDTVSLTLLAPGTSDHGRFGQPSISGAPFNESLYLINGVESRETVRGSALDLYIEDAIQETTVASSGISAEYGRFSGGVVNVVTRSGGNELSGSLRLNLVNDDWTASTPRTVDKENEVNQIYEMTLGGRVLRDRLWYFLGARDLSTSRMEQTLFGGTYPTTHEQTRYEAKLTFSPHVSHRLTGSYLEVEEDRTNTTVEIPIDLPSLSPSASEPISLWSLSYTGVLSDRLFVEALFSDRDAESLVGSVQTPGDRVNGSWIWHVPYGATGHDAEGCASCGPATAGQKSAMLRLSYFVAIPGFGSHDLVAGYQGFSDLRKKNTFTSASSFDIRTLSTPTLNEDGVYAPNIAPMNWETWIGSAIYWNPIPVLSTGNELETTSFFVNDTWRLNSRVTLNLGLRYDATSASDATGDYADHDRWSPRLGMSWDLQGNGEWLLSASASRYTAYVPSWLSLPGSFWQLSYLYLGPDTTGMPADEAVQVVFDWFDSVGGVGNFSLLTGPLLNAGLELENLRTPYGDELTVGLTKRFGGRGLFRADYVHREYGDFFARTTPGTVIAVDLSPIGLEGSVDTDLSVVSNTNGALSREYDGLHTQLQYRFSDRFDLGATYTYSHTRGTFAGETVDGQGFIYGEVNAIADQTYPEYHDPRWSAAKGDLPQDQRHKLRLWMLWDILSTSHHHLSIGLLQSYTSGSPYGSLAGVPFDDATLEYIGEHGYVTPPNGTDYWFEPSGTYRTDNVTSTDLAINYAFLLNLGGVGLELFLQPEVTNLFNETATVRENALVFPTSAFNPFTEEPVEGVHWQKASTFGLPLVPGDYQTPRTFRVSLGVRF